MFRIAFIGQKGIPCTQGGVEKHVEELSIRLANNGHEVFVYTRPRFVPKQYKKYENVNLISLPSLRTKNLDAISHTFISTLHAITKRVDIIHYQGIGPSLLTWLPKLFNRKIKVIATVHSADWEHQKWSLFAQHMLKTGAKFACKFADEALAVSRGLQKYCLAKCKTDVTYIPNGVSQEVRSKKQEASRILDNFNLEPNKYILVVSRLVKHKGIHYLIEAFKNIKDDFNNNKELACHSSERLNIRRGDMVERVKSKGGKLKLVIVGSTAFTENYQQFLQRLTKNRNDIVFTGTQTGADLDSLFRNAYLYCQPSESEGLPIAVLEAMAYGKAVLISNIDENMELIHGNSSTGAIGFDFENKNVLDLTNKLKILLKNSDVVKSVGKKAKEYVKLYYNWEEITARTERLYKSTVLVKDKVKSKLRLALARYIFFL